MPVTKPRVLIIEGAPAPYRVDFWNVLGQHVDLTVWCQSEHERGRTWQIEGLGGRFRFEVLPGWRIGEDKYLNPAIVHKLATASFDACIMSLNSSPTEMLAMGWLRQQQKPFIWKSDGGFPRHGEWGHVSALKEYVKRWIFPKASAYLSSGPACTHYLTYYGADPEAIVEYPFAQDMPPAHLTPVPEEERWRRREEEGLAGCVFFNAGQFVARKGLDVLLDAYAKIAAPETASLLLIGAGEQEAALREQAEGLPNVVFKPFLQRDALAQYYSLSDVFVFPTRYDIYGLVVPEAMARGLPVIATRWAGSAHALMREGETGFVIDRDDVDTLADRMRQLLDPARRATMGAAGRAAVQGHTLESMAKQHLAAIDRVVRQAKGP